jgi:hypothetical protein
MQLRRLQARIFANSETFVVATSGCEIGSVAVLQALEEIAPVIRLSSAVIRTGLDLNAKPTIYL